MNETESQRNTPVLSVPKKEKKKKALFQEGKGTRCPKKFTERLVQQVLSCYSLSVTNTGIKGEKKVPLLALMTKKIKK